MELSQIRYVLRVAEKKNFSKAAQELSVAQPTLTQQIGKLESELGVALFNRTTRSVSLTDAGVDFVTYASRVMEDIENLHDIMNTYTAFSSGSISIGVMPHVSLFNLPHYISKYAARNENVNINIIQAPSKELTTELLDNKLDVAFIDEHELDDWMLPSLNIRHIRKEPLYLVMNASSPMAKNKRIELSWLDNSNILRYRGFEALEEIEKRALSTQSISYHVVGEYYSQESLFNAISENKGIAFVPGSMRIHDNENICFRRCSPSITCSLSAAVSKNQTVSVEQNALVEYLSLKLSFASEE